MPPCKGTIYFEICNTAFSGYLRFFDFSFFEFKKDTILLFNILIGVTAWNIAGTLYSLYAFI